MPRLQFPDPVARCLTPRDRCLEGQAGQWRKIPRLYLVHWQQVAYRSQSQELTRAVVGQQNSSDTTQQPAPIMHPPSSPFHRNTPLTHQPAACVPAHHPVAEVEAYDELLEQPPSLLLREPLPWTAVRKEPATPTVSTAPINTNSQGRVGRGYQQRLSGAVVSPMSKNRTSACCHINILNNRSLAHNAPQKLASSLAQLSQLPRWVRVIHDDK